MTRNVTLLGALLAVSACSGTPDAGQGNAGEILPVVGAQTAVVEPRAFTETVGAIGIVTQRPGYYAAMAAPAPTRVSRVFVTVGQPVRAGEPLVEFEQQSFNAELQSAQAGLINAQRAYDRAQQLVQQGISARKDLEAAAAALAQAKAAEVAARRDQQLSTLRSPIDGVVTVMNAVLGASADMNTTLVEVTDPHALDVTLRLTAGQAAEVRPGQRVALTAGQSAKGDALGTGRVADVGAELDSTTGTVPVRVVVAHPNRPLRVGETVMGSIVIATHPKALAVPSDALVPEGEGYHVFVVDSEGIAHTRPVTPGARNGQYVEILKGLAAGETVVAYGAFGVTDSAKIVTRKP
jgi:membrane fusion protein, heavy metal efflux system